MTKLVSGEMALQFLFNLKNARQEFSYNPKKHQLIILQDGDEAIHFRLPVTFPHPDNVANEELTERNFVILLIQSGSSALAYCEGEEMVDHKVFKSYMVRKKQGKSQLKYLKTKGKSKAGSRVRLGNTISFFEDINERLTEYFEENAIDRIALSCSKTLIPYLFNSKVACPFSKDDERILKIPKHIHTPGYDVLTETHDYLLKGEINYEEEHKELVKQLLPSE